MNVNFERLTILRDYLHDNATTDGFNMDYFFRHYLTSEEPRIVVAEPSCGMVACMAGWACLIPEFQQAGLRARLSGLHATTPYYEQQVGFDAMARFFGMSEDEARYLFDNAGRSYAPDMPLNRSAWQVKDAVNHLTYFIEHYEEVLSSMTNDEDYNHDEDDDFEDDYDDRDDA